ncbi:MAG: NAD(P)/FAD-dependent oxidoreductase [Candidatus Aenigmatarchaeota archaeon]
MQDVIVVGASIAGLSTANECAKKGLKTTVIEEHARLGVPVKCSGLYSKRICKLAGINKSFAEHSIRGAIFHAPSGYSFEIKKTGVAAYVVDRAKLDRHVAGEAVRNGANIIANARFDSLKSTDNGIAVKTSKTVLKTKLVAGCDGANSRVSGYVDPSQTKKLHGMIAITNQEDYSDFVDLYFDNKKYPGFFAWKIPRGATTEYGVAASVEHAANAFRGFLKENNVKKHSTLSGMIPMGLKKTYAERIVLVGDAACQVKPLTGGGVIYSLICSRIAANAFRDAITQNRFDESFMKRYEDEWKKQISGNIRLGLAMRGLYSLMPNWQIDAALRLLGFAPARKLIEKFGDMDFTLKLGAHGV